MKIVIFFAVLACAIAYVAAQAKAPAKGAAPAPTGTYTTKYDNINLDEILNNKRVIQNYVQCLLGNKPCSAEGNELKKHLPDALSTQCLKCTQKQKDGAYKVIKTIQRDYPKEWTQLQLKWDPKGDLFRKFEQTNPTLAAEFKKTGK